jgi:hypothetical protein
MVAEGDLVGSIEHAWEASPWLSILALIALIGRIGAIYLGIRNGSAVAALPRLSYFFFCVVYSTLIFVAAGLVLMLGVGVDVPRVSLLPACLAGIMGSYFLTGASVRRLADIGWSRNWAWLLVFDGLVAPFVLILCFTRGRIARAEVPISCA